MNEGAIKAKYRTGDVVRIRPDAHPGHHRTPGYLKGRQGVVQRHLGNDRNPETLAYGADGLPPVPVYQVRFLQSELWPDYPGPPTDILTADLLEHWLLPADPPESR